MYAVPTVDSHCFLWEARKKNISVNKLEHAATVARLDIVKITKQASGQQYVVIP